MSASIPKNRLVSVIVPAYNAEKYLAEALESILAQTWSDLEIILVNDGSTDKTEEIARSYGQVIRYLNQPNKGIGGAINAGLRNASGAMLAFLDADDLWHPHKLALQMNAMEQNPGTDLVFGHIMQFISPELDEESRRKLAATSETPEPGYLKTTLLARRGAFEKVGEFSENFRAGDFLDWYMRAMEKGCQILMLPDLISMRRIHLSNTAARDTSSQQDYARVVHAALLRRRGAAPPDSSKQR